MFADHKAHIVEALNDMCRALDDIGVVGALHQHTGTCVETREETYAVMEAVNTRYVKFGPDVGQRAVCFVVGAQRLVKDKDTIRANEWLREAGMLLKRSEADERTARIALGIASTYGQFDAQAALEWLSFAVRLVNKTSPASLNDDRAPRFKRISGVTPITDVAGDTRGFSLQSAAGVFPADQFEQALSVLNALTSPEARGHAVLTLCSNYLKTSPSVQRKS